MRTKVVLDKEGIMKVIHLVNISDRFGEQYVPQVSDSQGIVHVKFCILPEETFDYEEDEEY